MMSVDSVELMVEFDDFRGLFQAKWFYDSTDLNQ